MPEVYKFSPLKVVHFDIDKDKIEEYLSVRNELRLIKIEFIPKHLIYDMLDDITESKVDIRYTFRLLDQDKTQNFGSYISEQFFYIKYVQDDEYTRKQIVHLFSNSHFTSEQEFDKLVKQKGLPENIRFHHFTWPDFVVEELFRILFERRAKH